MPNASKQSLPAAAGNAGAAQRRHRWRRLTATATVTADGSLVALTPSAVRYPEGGCPRVKCCIYSHPGPAETGFPSKPFSKRMEHSHVPSESLQVAFPLLGVDTGVLWEVGIPCPEAPSRCASAPEEPSACTTQSPGPAECGTGTPRGWTLVSALVPKHIATVTGVQEQVPCAAPGCSILAKSCCIT